MNCINIFLRKEFICESLITQNFFKVNQMMTFFHLKCYIFHQDLSELFVYLLSEQMHQLDVRSNKPAFVYFQRPSHFAGKQQF